MKRSSVIWHSGETAFVELSIADPPSSASASLARARFRKVTLLFRAHPGNNVIRIRKVKGHLLRAGDYRITIFVRLGTLHGPAHTLKLKIAS